MKFILRKEFAYLESSSEPRYVALLPLFQNNIDPNSVKYEWSIELAKRFETFAEAQRWQAVFSRSRSTVEIVQVAK
jgi:hypothetical protein